MAAGDAPVQPGFSGFVATRSLILQKEQKNTFANVYASRQVAVQLEPTVFFVRIGRLVCSYK